MFHIILERNERKIRKSKFKQKQSNKVHFGSKIVQVLYLSYTPKKKFENLGYADDWDMASSQENGKIWKHTKQRHQRKTLNISST